jgi:streptogrisin D
MVRSVQAALVAVVLVLCGIAAAPASATAGPSIAGGDQLTRSGGFRCTLSFNLSARKVLTGARCGPVGTRWNVGATSVGVISSVLAGKDAAILTIDNPAVVQLGAVRFGSVLKPLTGAARAHVGQVVTFHSATSGTGTGTVTGINQTVVFADGTLTGLDRISSCAAAGTGAAPVIAGSTALSHLTGGSGCTAYATPVVPILTATGLGLYTG